MEIQFNKKTIKKSLLFTKIALIMVLLVCCSNTPTSKKEGNKLNENNIELIISKSHQVSDYGVMDTIGAVDTVTNVYHTACEKLVNDKGINY